MPGLDDIDDDDVPCPTRTAATVSSGSASAAASPASAGGGSGGAMTMDDIFGGLGEAPAKKAAVASAPVVPATAPVATHSSVPVAGAGAAAAAAAAPSELDDFFSAAPAAAANPRATSPGAGFFTTAAGTSPPKKSTDLLGGGGTLGSLVETGDRPYVPPPGVVKLMSHYEVMSLRENATADEISRAYRRLAINFHPDKRGSSLTPDEEFFFKAVTVAHEVIGDAEQRAEYDKARKAAKEGAGKAADDLFAHMA